MEKDKVAAVIGCYTSASRKAVLPVIEKLKGLLYYPTYYEGLEMSPNIMYTAQEATQSAIAAMEWLYKNRGKSFYMIGSDYIWPRTTIKIAKATLTLSVASSWAKSYYPLGHIEFSSEINKIKAAKPDVILDCVVGGSNVAFYKQLTAAGINGTNQTLLSLAVSEEEVSGIGAENTVGTLTCMGYFQSLKNPANEKFVKAFKAKYGANRVLGNTLECGYISVHLWKLAAEKAKSFDVEKVVEASSDLPIDAPEGKMQVRQEQPSPVETCPYRHILAGRSGQHDLRVAVDRAESVPEVVTVSNWRSAARLRTSSLESRFTNHESRFISHG